MVPPYAYTDPTWDEAAAQLAVQPACLCLWETPDPQGMALDVSEEARAALEERGYVVGVGIVADPDACCVLLRLTKAQ